MMGQLAPELVDRVETTLQRLLPEQYSWPGSVRELEQAIRRILLTGHYQASASPTPSGPYQQLIARIESQDLSADELLAGYCALLHTKHGTYEEVARRLNLDRRTVKKYLQGQE